MSFRNWLFNPPLAVGLISALLMAGASLSNYQHQSQSTQKRSDEQLADAVQGVNSTRIAPIARGEVPRRQPNPDRNEWRQEEDLVAQQDMAKWAWWMMLASFMSIAVAAVGVWFVKQTLDATRAAVVEAKRGSEAAQDAVEVTRATSQRQLRAYIAIQGGSFSLVNLIEGGRGVAFHVELKNLGQTPAYGFSTWVKPPRILPFDAIPFGDPTPLSERTGFSIVGPGASAHIQYTIRLEDADFDAIRNKTRRIYVWGGADFTDIFDQSRYFIFRSCSSEGIFDIGQPLAMAAHKAGYESN